jgi:two-component system sensor histidine kinase PilS (NtrC family)
LLVFRAAVATCLLAITAAADAAGLPVSFLSGWLYLVVLSSFAVVLVLAALLRYARWDPVVLSVAHLASAVVVAMLIVQVTGGVESAFSFLYLLVVLDGAILGGQRVSLTIATFAAGAYGAQLALQATEFVELYGEAEVLMRDYVRSFITHTASFYSIAFLGGYLATQTQRARAVITEVQDEFRRAEAQHREVLEALPVGVLVIDEKRRVVLSNRVGKELLGSHGRIGALIPDALASAGSDGPSSELSLDVGGRMRLVAVSRSELEAGGLSIMVLEDETEVRKLEGEMRAKERLASIGELSAAIAHEIRNPLASISGAIELLQGDDEDPEVRQRLEGVALKEIERLDALVNDFLLYARPSPPVPVPVDLVRLIREVCSLAERDGSAEGHSLEIDAPMELNVVADAEQLRQVLWNLLRNAFEASAETGPVAVALRTDHDEVSVEVGDRGSGVDSAIKDVLFEPFRTTKRKGSGLGLALVHRIVSGHGGSVSLNPRDDGQGTVARVTLPRRAPVTPSAVG